MRENYCYASQTHLSITLSLFPVKAHGEFVGPRSAISAFPGNILEMQLHGPEPQSKGIRNSGSSSHDLDFNKPWSQY